MSQLELKIRCLPPNLFKEVEDFVDFLLNKHKKIGKKTSSTLSLSWAGALKKLGKKHSSVELQHKITKEWWPK